MASDPGCSSLGDLSCQFNGVTIVVVRNFIHENYKFSFIVVTVGTGGANLSGPDKSKCHNGELPISLVERLPDHLEV